MDDVLDALSIALTWPPALFFSFVSQLPAWPGLLAVTAILTLLAGIGWGIARREAMVWSAAVSLVITHLFYLATTTIHLWINWPGVPAMIGADVLLAVAQLGLFGIATWRSARSRPATLLAGWFGLTYAAPFALYAYLNTYYVGL